MKRTSPEKSPGAAPGGPHSAESLQHSDPDTAGPRFPYRDLVEALQDAIFELDATGSIVYANARALQDAGLPLLRSLQILEQRRSQPLPQETPYDSSGTTSW